MNSPRMSNAGRSSHLGNAAVSPNTMAETRGLSHHDTSCPRSTNFKCGCVAPTFGNACIRDCRNLKVHHGYIDSTPVDVLRDTGCSSVIVRASLVDDSQLTGEQHLLYMIDNSVLHVPTAICHIRTPFFSGEVEVLCLQNPVCNLILGNIENIQEEDVNFDCLHTVEQPSNSKQFPNASGSSICTQTCPLESIDNKVGCVATRSQTKVRDRSLKPLIVPSQIDTSISVESFREAQINDPSLNKFFYLADREFPEESRDALTHWFVVENGLLYRVFKRSADENEVKQLMVPEIYRSKVLKLGHETIFAGHLGIKKTFDRIVTNLYCPCIFSRVHKFCTSCDNCQRTARKGDTKKVPLVKVPIVSIPFSKIAIDLIGPIDPPSQRGHRWVLVIIDYATRYPEAIPLRNIDTESISEALLSVFSRVGIPSCVVSDQGTQFVSKIMQEVSRLLSIKWIKSSPYHPQANGLVEKCNATLKSMLRKICEEKPKDWDRYIEPLLFAYREAPQHSLVLL